MTEPSAPDTRSLVFRLLESYCARNGLRLSAADPHGHAGLVEGPGGKRRFFKGTRFDLNPYGAAEIANDKAYAAHFLKAAGLNVPAGLFVPGDRILNGTPLPADVRDFVGQNGFPLYVKPNQGREGRGVIRVDTDDALAQGLATLARHHPALLVQEEIPGMELRVLVLDGEVLCAFERHAPKVTGDGVSTIGELIAAHGRIDPTDNRIDLELARQHLLPQSVAGAGRTITLLPVSNLSAGGMARIVTAGPAPELQVLARKAAATLGLRYAGVDLIVPLEPRPDIAAVVLEVNAAPGLSNLHRQGGQEAETIERVYEKVFDAAFGA